MYRPRHSCLARMHMMHHRPCRLGDRCVCIDATRSHGLSKSPVPVCTASNESLAGRVRGTGGRGARRHEAIGTATPQQAGHKHIVDNQRGPRDRRDRAWKRPRGRESSLVGAAVVALRGLTVAVVRAAVTLRVRICQTHRSTHSTSRLLAIYAR